MAIATVAVGDPIPAAIENAQTNQLNLQPTIFVVPTTTSSGVSISTNGLVTFTAVTEIICDAAFAAAWVKHKITGAYQADSTLGTLSMRLRTTVPADVTSASYDATTNLARNATVTSATNNSAPSTSWAIQPQANKLNALNIELFNAAVATETEGFSWAGTHADPSVQSAANVLNGMYLTQADDTIMGGFKLTFTQASSGWLRILNEA